MPRLGWKQGMASLLASLTLMLSVGTTFSRVAPFKAAVTTGDPLVYVVRDVTNRHSCVLTISRNVGTSSETHITTPCPAGSHWAQLRVHRSEALAKGERYVAIPAVNSGLQKATDAEQQVEALKDANQQALQKRAALVTSNKGIVPLTLSCDGSNSTVGMVDTDAWYSGITWNVSVRYTRGYDCNYRVSNSEHDARTGDPNSWYRGWHSDKYSGTRYYPPEPPRCVHYPDYNLVGFSRNWQPNVIITPGQTWEQVLVDPDNGGGVYCDNANREWDDLLISY